MNSIGAFVHLYHVWGILGLITAALYGRRAYKHWIYVGGRYSKLHTEWYKLCKYHLGMIGHDWRNFCKAIFYRFSGLDYKWPKAPLSPWKYSGDTVLLFGIMIGGVSRFIAAMYWSEKNTDWMTTETVWVPAIPVLFAIIGDFAHQSTGWPDKKHRIRFLLFFSVLWVLIGSFRTF